MALLLPPNVTVNIYRTASPGTPYILGAAGPQNVKGYLKPAVQNGRFGSALYLKWTHILYLDPSVDVRDAYNSQLDPARNNALADTVVLLDAANAPTKVAFYVSFVEQVARGTPASYLRAYLDRFQPSAWPTSAL
jgi:hypothetical protein